MERPARAGEPVAWKKNANFSWPQRSRAVCITLLLHARISSAPLVFYTRERGEESVGRFTNRRRRLNVRGKWPAIWRLGTVGNTARVQDSVSRCVRRIESKDDWRTIFETIVYSLFTNKNVAFGEMGERNEFLLLVLICRYLILFERTTLRNIVPRKI